MTPNKRMQRARIMDKSTLGLGQGIGASLMRGVMRHKERVLRVAVPGAVLAIGVLLVALRFRFGVSFSFAHAALNWLSAIIVVCSIPISLVLLGRSMDNRLLRWPLTLAGAVIALPALPISAICGLFVLGTLDGRDSSFEPIAELAEATATCRLYRTNFGATTDFGLMLRREWNVVPGVRLTAIVQSYNAARDASLHHLSPGVGLLSVDAYGPEHPAFSYEFRL